MSDPCAMLPMYDWPEVRQATDRLWCDLRDALRQVGIPAPAALTRDRSLEELWNSPALILGQTCGMPYVSALRDKVALLGTPDYAVPGCDPGWYRSVIVVRADERAENLSGFRDRRWAFNEKLSQSGYQAMLHCLHDEGLATVEFFQPVHSGSHRASVQLVAGGKADLASIDYVSWRLARTFLPESDRLRVLQLTAPTPGLPYIAGLGSGAGPAVSGSEGAVAAAAIGSAIDELPPFISDTLGLRGFWHSTPADYDVIQQRRL